MILGCLQLRGAICPTCRLDGDRRKTVRALFGCWVLWCWCPLEFVDASDEKKDGKGNYHKVNNGIYEQTVVDGDCASLLSLGKRSKGSGHRTLFEKYEKVRKIHVAQ